VLTSRPASSSGQPVRPRCPGTGACLLDGEEGVVVGESSPDRPIRVAHTPTAAQAAEMVLNRIGGACHTARTSMGPQCNGLVTRGGLRPTHRDRLDMGFGKSTTFQLPSSALGFAGRALRGPRHAELRRSSPTSGSRPTHRARLLTRPPSPTRLQQDPTRRPGELTLPGPGSAGTGRRNPTGLEEGGGRPTCSCPSKKAVRQRPDGWVRRVLKDAEPLEYSRASYCGRLPRGRRTRGSGAGSSSQAANTPLVRRPRRAVVTKGRGEVADGQFRGRVRAHRA